MPAFILFTMDKKNKPIIIASTVGLVVLIAFAIYWWTRKEESAALINTKPVLLIESAEELAQIPDKLTNCQTSESWAKGKTIIATLGQTLDASGKVIQVKAIMFDKELKPIASFAQDENIGISTGNACFAEVDINKNPTLYYNPFFIEVNRQGKIGYVWESKVRMK
jgi:hypothetical protein